MGRRKQLTEREVASIQAMIEQGYDAAAIKARYGFTAAQLKRNGIVVPRKEKPRPLPPKTKRCPGCGLVKPISEMTKSWMASGLRNLKYCNDCRDARKEVRLEKITRRKGETEVEWRLRRERTHRTLWTRDCKLMSRCGATLEQFNKMFDAAQGRCEICACELLYTAEHDNPRRMQVACLDHCHFTGILRGVLCVTCNLCIGRWHHSIDKLADSLIALNSTPARKRRGIDAHFLNNPQYISAAIEYLKKHSPDEAQR